MRLTKQKLLMAGVSALALGLAAAAKAQPTESTFSFSTFSSATSSGFVVNDLAAQLNGAVEITANAFTAAGGSSTSTTTQLFTVDFTLPLDPIVVGVPGTATSGTVAEGSGLFRVFLGSGESSVGAIESNAVRATAIGSDATRLMDLAAVSSSSPTGLLALVQANNLAEITAQIGNSVGGSSPTTQQTVSINGGAPITISSADAAALAGYTNGTYTSTNAQYAGLLTLLTNLGVPVTSASHTLNLQVQQITPTGGSAGVTFQVDVRNNDRAPTDLTLSISGNTVEAAAMFNRGSQSATGNAQSPAGGSPASISLGFGGLAGGTVTAPVAVASVQSNAGVNGLFVGPTIATTGPILNVAPSASVYNTTAEVRLLLDEVFDGESNVPNRIVAQVGNNTVAARAAGNTVNNLLSLTGGGQFSNGLAVMAVQNNGSFFLGGPTIDGEQISAITALTQGTRLSITSNYVALTDGEVTATFGTGPMLNSTATILGNTVLSSAIGNAATNRLLDSGLASISGNYALTTANVTRQFPSIATVSGDAVLANSQVNTGLLTGAVTNDTTLVIDAEMRNSIAAIDNNTVGAASTLNIAANTVSLPRTVGVTAAAFNLQTNLLSAPLAAVEGTRLEIQGIRDSAGVTVSLSGNTIESAARMNVATQSVSMSSLSPTQLSSGESPRAAGVQLLGSGIGGGSVVRDIAVGAQLSSTSVQTNLFGLGLDGEFATPTAITNNTRILATLGNDVEAAPNSVSVSGNAVLAGVLGNLVNNSIQMSSMTATHQARGTAVVSMQANEGGLGGSGAVMSARVSDTRLQISTADDLSGSALMLNNTVASSAVANSATNTLGNTLFTSLVPVNQPWPTTTVGTVTTVLPNFNADSQTVLGDFVVANLQGNAGINVTALTGGEGSAGTTLRIYADDDFRTALTAIENNTISATATLNQASNTMTLVRGDGIVSTLASVQINQPSGFGGTVSAASATTRNVTIAIEIDDDVTNSTQMLNSNTVAARASGNVATNTLRNNGVTFGSVLPTATVNIGGTDTVSADYQLANLQRNIGTVGTAMPITAEVRDVNFRILNLDSSGDQRNSMAQLGNNVVLASATGNSASNMVSMTGRMSASQSAASFQSNEFVSISANVQNVSFGIASARSDAFRQSSGSIVGNSVGAFAVGNNLMSSIGR